MRMRHLAALLLVLGLAAAACSSNDSNGGDGGSTGSGGGEAVSMSIRDFAFDPSALTGSPGQTLEISVTNQDDAEHSFTLDDETVSQDIEGGESATVEVTLPDSGSVGWHCTYHPTMTGTITVG